MWAFAALPSYEFTNAADAADWYGQHDISSVSYVDGKGMELNISGGDPYIAGPWRDFANVPMLATIRIFSETGGNGEFFWFTKPNGPVAGNEVGFVVPKGVWSEVKVRLPALPAQSALRLDAPGDHGKCWVQWIRFSELQQVSAPNWTGPSGEEPASDALQLTVGGLTMKHDTANIGRCSFSFNGTRMATGWDKPWICYQNGAGQPVWVDLQSAPTGMQQVGNGLQVFSIFTDPDHAVWRITQLFTQFTQPNCIEVSVTVNVDQPRSIYFLPLFMMFAENRERGLLPGMEYLDPQDTSSSKADFEMEDYKRRVPYPVKLTFPMMSMQANGKWLSLSWQQNKMVQAVYDTPDRLFNSGKHLMGAILSNWDNTVRDQLNPISMLPENLAANTDYKAQFCITAGDGANVTPSIKAYVARYHVPDIPDTGYNLQQFIDFSASGWLDTGQMVGFMFRPLAWFNNTWAAQYSAETAYNLDWMSRYSTNTTLQQRLLPLVDPCWEEINNAGLNYYAVSSNNYFIPSLLYGYAEENVQIAKQQAAYYLGPVRADGTVPYAVPATGINYARTHWADHANGLSGQYIAQALRNAVFSGDSALEQQCLQLCRLLSLYDDEAPRGAQTWEVPLHTPDIMASSWMCSSYLYAYELTGDKSLLDRAITWAWTGVPFVYLVNPTDGKVGPYATIPVFGATNWTGSWTGTPVQWCGLHYAETIRRLERFDPTGPWNQLWRGIEASSIQQCFTKDFDPAYQGWLPDSFNLVPQTQNGVAINPSSVFAMAVPFYTGNPLWDYRIYRQLGLSVQIPGKWIADSMVQKDVLSFNVDL